MGKESSAKAKCQTADPADSVDVAKTESAGTRTAGKVTTPRKISNSQRALAREQKRAAKAREQAEKKAAARRARDGITYTAGADGELFNHTRRVKPSKATRKQKMQLRSRPQSVVRRGVYFGLSCVIILALVFAGYFFIKWRMEIIATNRTIAEIQAASTVEEVTDSSGTEAILSGEDEGSMFWTYLRYSLIHVDLTDLLDVNPGTVGWLQVPGTSIDYPYVQTTDNDFYLDHSFDNSSNDAGWVFLDYRNNASLSYNTNSIIYAHGRLDGTMFGTLQNVLDATWQANAENHVIRTSTADEDALWQIFSVYRIGNTNDYLYTEFSSDEAYGEFLQKLVDRSVYTFEANVSSTDRILTLSTCIGDDDRVVVHAKLIKITYN